MPTGVLKKGITSSQDAAKKQASKGIMNKGVATKKPNPNQKKKMGPTGESPAYLEKMKGKKAPPKKKMM